MVRCQNCHFDFKPYHNDISHLSPFHFTYVTFDSIEAQLANVKVFYIICSHGMSYLRDHLLLWYLIAGEVCQFLPFKSVSLTF